MFLISAFCLLQYVEHLPTVCSNMFLISAFCLLQFVAHLPTVCSNMLHIGLLSAPLLYVEHLLYLLSAPLCCTSAYFLLQYVAYLPTVCSNMLHICLLFALIYCTPFYCLLQNMYCLFQYMYCSTSAYCLHQYIAHLPTCSFLQYCRLSKK